MVTDDLNGDGFADLVVLNPKTKNLSILLNKGDGTFFDPVNISTGKTAPQDLVIGDFNGSGGLDLAVSNPAGNITIFDGNGDGTFQAPVVILTPKFKPYALAAGDLLEDGHTDLVAISKTTSQVEVFAWRRNRRLYSLGPRSRPARGGPGGYRHRGF